LSGKVRVIVRKDIHAFVRKGMQEVQTPHKEVGDPDEQEITVIHESSGIPGDHKDTAGDHDTECFSKAVKEEIVIKACQIEPEQDDYPYCRGQRKTIS
jgi:hypothetical protein